MVHDHAIAAELESAGTGGGGIITLLIAETMLPISDRSFLTAYKAKLAATHNTRKEEDERFISILRNWVINLHKQ